MKSAIVPIIKNKSGESSNINNYRPIALVTDVFWTLPKFSIRLIIGHCIKSYQNNCSFSDNSNFIIFWYKAQSVCITWGQCVVKRKERLGQHSNI